MTDYAPIHDRTRRPTLLVINMFVLLIVASSIKRGFGSVRRNQASLLADAEKNTFETVEEESELEEIKSSAMLE